MTRSIRHTLTALALFSLTQPVAAAGLKADGLDSAASRSGTQGNTDWRLLMLEQHTAPSDVTLSPAPDALGLQVGDIGTGVAVPLARELASLVETQVATGISGLPERSMGGHLGARLGNGWGLQAGMRRTELDWGFSEDSSFAGSAWQGHASAGVNLGTLTFERQWDRYRGAYTLYSELADSGLAATAHRLQLQYYYGVRSSVGLAYTTGRYLDTSLAFANLASTEINNVGVTGEHWLTQAWAIDYRALLQDRGSDGLKPEIRVGLRYRF